jgi:hypothetical protein
MSEEAFAAEVTTAGAAPTVWPADTKRPESQLINAFVAYLRARPDRTDAESTREFNDGQTALDGVSRSDTDLAGVPAITVEPVLLFAVWVASNRAAV